MSPKPKEIDVRGLDANLEHDRDTVGDARGVLEVLYALKAHGRRRSGRELSSKP